ncbi:EamA family transporter [Leucobacter sp. M11]|uniref:EamA family transporter n=1 Tax=Leucobacter sp. M11 TaxID=2993565 RepID=UPI002D7FF8BF|nr:EamA family transporter [Leucobacter sp. M11]MEB4613192.1 EamA family transporter [Leucobacter sp. M11]
MTRVSSVPPQRSDVLRAVVLVLIGATGIQISAALSATLFASLGIFTVSSLRMLLGAIILLILVRPRLRRSRSEWLGIVIYGTTMAAMNVSIYAAIERIPLGVAVTIEFLGPCAVALAASRRVREALIALMALLGVAVLSLGSGGDIDPLGIVFALLAAVCFGGYTVFAARVGKAASGLDGVALSVTVSAALTFPMGVGGYHLVQPSQWGLLLIVAVIGVAIPFSADTMAARYTSARVVGTLFAIDPAMAALAGFLVLGQTMTVTGIIGLALVSISGAMLVGGAPRRSAAEE